MRINRLTRIYSLLAVTLFTFSGLFLYSCKDKDEEIPAPSISSFSPSSGGAGTVVTITGDGFDETTTGNTVKFGTAQATVTAAARKLIVVAVPSGVSGDQSITVTNSRGTATSATKFNVVGPAVLGVASFSPASGPVGTVVTITGTAFDATAANNTVKFGTTTASVVNATTTTLTVLVPAGINGNFPISVQVGSTTATSTAQFNVNTQLTADLVGTAVTGSTNNESEITTNTTLSANIRYNLKGWVYIKDGVTLTIPAGTIIKGDKATKGALIVEPGGKIIAQGTDSNPIVFTSALSAGLRDYGDWGGLVLVGKAPANKAQDKIEGGPRTLFPVAAASQDAADNSGTLQYVRVEYAGVALSPNNEINGLTLYAVGTGTKIDHVQVSYANDDSYEWFGGTVNMSYIIAHRGWDDDFDTDNGYSGSLQFGISTRDLTQADQSGSKGFESDNDANGSTNLPQTKAVFSNFTITGPLNTYSSGVLSNSGMSANYVAGIHIRRNSSISLYNSVVAGWPAGILIDAGTTAKNIDNGTLNIKSVVVAGIFKASVTGSSAGNDKTIIYVGPTGGAGSLTPTTAMGDTTANTATSGWGAASGPNAWFNTAAYNNKRVTDATSVLTDHYKASSSSISTPDFSLKTGYVAPSATALPASFNITGFVQNPAFIGAIGTGTSWGFDKSWVNWNPQTTAY